MRNIHEALIVGAGLAGLGAAIRLDQAGVHDVVVLERSDRVGGTWRDNTYPGASCDIPSLLYSYSFAPKPDWTKAWSDNAEILSYIEDVVHRFDLLPKIRFGADVVNLTFDEELGIWTATTADGITWSARSAIFCAGPLANASLPDIPGIKDYDGTKIHSARWNHDYEFAGKHVAVIGTGASGVQIIPELVEQAASVKVFQRTPGWVMPRPNLSQPNWLTGVFRRVPAAQSAARAAIFWGHEAFATALVWNTPVTALAERIGKANLRRQVADPWLRRQLTPDFRPGCKRMLMTSNYLPALQRDNCKLITWPIVKLTPGGLRTADGIEHKLDAIVFATGFDVIGKTGTPFPVHGRNGRVLGDEWATGAYAYKSVSVSGYPNLFFTFGPNSGPGHNSALLYMESQIDYAVRGVKLILDNNLAMLDVREDRQAEYNEKLQRRLATTTWNSGCRSWYLTSDGFNPSMYPGFATQFVMQLRKVILRDYDVVKRQPVTASTDTYAHA